MGNGDWLVTWPGVEQWPVNGTDVGESEGVVVGYNKERHARKLDNIAARFHGTDSHNMLRDSVILKSQGRVLMVQPTITQSLEVKCFT